MKKIIFITTIFVVFLIFGLTASVVAQQNNTVPVLMQQNLSQMPPAVRPPLQNIAPGQPAPQPPNPGMQGVQVVQTIPTEILVTNLAQAVQTARKLNKLLTVGKVWLTRAPGGELELKAGLLYQGVVVAVLRLNPSDGSVLPLGVNPHVFQSRIPIQTVKSKLSAIVSQLKIMPVAEFTEPEACWSFPVALGNGLVAHVKIYYDGLHVLQDYVANQEMVFYGQ